MVITLLGDVVGRSRGGDGVVDTPQECHCGKGCGGRGEDGTTTDGHSMLRSVEERKMLPTCDGGAHR